jgi:hypothetical protein
MADGCQDEGQQRACKNDENKLADHGCLLDMRLDGAMREVLTPFRIFP